MCQDFLDTQYEQLFDEAVLWLDDVLDPGAVAAGEHVGERNLPNLRPEVYIGTLQGPPASAPGGTPG